MPAKPKRKNAEPAPCAAPGGAGAEEEGLEVASLQETYSQLGVELDKAQRELSMLEGLQRGLQLQLEMKSKVTPELLARRRELLDALERAYEGAIQSAASHTFEQPAVSEAIEQLAGARTRHLGEKERVADECLAMRREIKALEEIVGMSPADASNLQSQLAELASGLGIVSLSLVVDKNAAAALSIYECAHAMMRSALGSEAPVVEAFRVGVGGPVEAANAPAARHGNKGDEDSGASG